MLLKCSPVAKKKLGEQFHKRITTFLGKNEDNGPGKEAIENLLKIEELPDSFTSDKDLVFLHSCLRQIHGTSKFFSHKELLRLVEYFFRQELSDAKKEEQFQKSIQQNLSKLPGDLLLLPFIEGLPFQPAIAWLRILREVSEKNIVLKHSEVKGNMAVRIGRLQPVFRYRVTQMLAHVFSDIGLPTAYESKIEEQINQFCCRI